MNVLLLIIGHNNLSNVALIKFLKKSNLNFDKIGVIFTNDTFKNFENLKKLLNEDFFEINVEDVKENFIKVKNRVFEKLKSLNNIESIFLDFTGGLKSMSVGAFLAVDEYELNENKKYFSYVFYDRQENTSKIVFKKGDIFNLNEALSINEIAGVYGVFDLEYKKDNSEFFDVKNVIWLLDKVKNQEKEFFDNLWDKDFKELKNLNWKESIKDINLPLDLSNKKLQKLQKYIRGDFLEEYIFYMLNEIKDEVEIYEIAWNVRKGKEAKFEIDVIASKNNNLYLFSCTTDKKKTTAKQKGFEAKEKATQLGGKNAKMILVSCIEEDIKNDLLEDLEDKKGGTPSEVIVYEDLINPNILKQKLKGIFNAG